MYAQKRKTTLLVPSRPCVKDSFSLPTGKAIGYDTKSTKKELQKESNALSRYGYNIQDTPTLYEHLFKLP